MNPKATQRAGVIDIGTSSIKLIIGEVTNGDITVLESLKNVIPLGKYAFYKGRMFQEVINQTVTILDKYRQALKEYDVSDIMVIATTAVREAGNRDMFIDTVFRKTGFSIEVLTVGDVVYYIDSYLSYKLKNRYPIHSKNLLIAELGAGSLDVSVMEKGFALMNMGLPLGALRLTQLANELDGSIQETNESLQEYIENFFIYLKKALPNISLDDIILVDENFAPYIQSILADKKSEEKFFPFTRGDSESLLSLFSDRNSEDIAATYHIPLEIADMIPAYTTILHRLFSLTGQDHVFILETSLQEAILANRLLNLDLSDKYNKTNQLISVAMFLCKKYGVDLNHSENVAKMSETFFKKFKDHLGLKDEDLIYLLLAAYLHDIGTFIHNRAHHKHTEYIISQLNLFRLSEDDVKIIACVARYHRKATPRNTHMLYSSLPSDKQILVQKLCSLLRMANALDRTHKQKVHKLEVKMNKNQDVTLVVHTKENFNLEKAAFLDKKGFFEEITGNKTGLSIKSD